MNTKFGKTKDLEVNKYRLVEQMVHATIKNIVDAIVELVTNSDDSYNKIKKSDMKGKIEVFITRDKKGFCNELKIIDHAGGMDLPMLDNALTFAGVTSGFYEGKTVRGFFGRGLKESGLKLGITTISTIKDGKLAEAEFQWDKNEKKAICRISEDTISIDDETRKKLGIITGNGTNVSIICNKEVMKCPDYKTLKSQFENHYALREINSSNIREVVLNYTSEEKDRKESYKTEIQYEYPQGKELLNGEKVKLPEFNDEIIITLYESNIALEKPYNNPYAKSGLLIKTSGAILDNQLFRYGGEAVGCYFFGTVECEGIARRIRENDETSLIDPNRGGIEWKHRYCQAIQNEVEKIIEPFIEKKRRELEKDKPKPKISEKTKKIFDNLCSLLNKFAKEEIKDLDLEGDEGLDTGDKIKNLIIRPEKIKLQLNKERQVSVYMPLQGLGVNKVKIESDNPLIQVLDSEVIMSAYNKYPTILRGRFRLIGRKVGEIGTITCSIMGDIATAEASVVPETKSKDKDTTLRKPKGGIFTGIEANTESEPDQRVRYEANTGKIQIYTEFPSVSLYFNSGNLDLKNLDQKAMLAELIGEAFCRYMARYLIDNGKYIIFQGNEIEGVNRAMNDMQKKYLSKIHEAIT